MFIFDFKCTDKRFYYIWPMDYKGLAIETNAFEFNDQLHEKTDQCEVDFDIEAKVYSNIIVSTLDMQYYKSHDRLTPLASIRTTLKFVAGK